jgi:hypothetical protein
MMQLNLLGKEEQMKSQTSKWSEIIKIRDEIKTKNLYKESMQHKVGSFL